MELIRLLHQPIGCTTITSESMELIACHPKNGPGLGIRITPVIQSGLNHWATDVTRDSAAELLVNWCLRLPSRWTGCPGTSATYAAGRRTSATMTTCWWMRMCRYHCRGTAPILSLRLDHLMRRCPHQHPANLGPGEAFVWGAHRIATPPETLRNYPAWLCAVVTCVSLWTVMIHKIRGECIGYNYKQVSLFWLCANKYSAQP